MLNIGIPAPDFVGESTQGTIHLKEHIGQKNIVLLFYPQDESLISRNQLTATQDVLEDLSRLDTMVIGCAQDSLESQHAFAKEQGYTFPLISDPQGTIAQAFGVEKRNVFIIDLDGVICYAAKGNPPTDELITAIENALY